MTRFVIIWEMTTAAQPRLNPQIGSENKLILTDVHSFCGALSILLVLVRGRLRGLLTNGLRRVAGRELRAAFLHCFVRTTTGVISPDLDSVAPRHHDGLDARTQI
jgi:hypothetical protein